MPSISRSSYANYSISSKLIFKSYRFFLFLEINPSLSKTKKVFAASLGSIPYLSTKVLNIVIIAPDPALPAPHTTYFYLHKSLPCFFDTFIAPFKPAKIVAAVP